MSGFGRAWWAGVAFGVAVMAAPGAEVWGDGNIYRPPPPPPVNRYRAEVEDLRVKVQGGFARELRSWSMSFGPDGALISQDWIRNQALGAPGFPTYIPGLWQGPPRADLSQLTRAGYHYPRVAPSGWLYLYRGPGEYKTLEWDRDGREMTWHDAARHWIRWGGSSDFWRNPVTETTFGDGNGVTARKADGVTTDRRGRAVVSETSDGSETVIRDRTGREVRYQGRDAIDVRGNRWQVVLTKYWLDRIDPLGRTTRVYFRPDNGELWSVEDALGTTYYGGSYNESTQQTHRNETSAMGISKDTWFDADGALLRYDVNCLTLMTGSGSRDSQSMTDLNGYTTIGIAPAAFIALAHRFLLEFGSAVGSPARLVEVSARRQTRYLRGIRAARRLFGSRPAA